MLEGESTERLACFVFGEGELGGTVVGRCVAFLDRDLSAGGIVQAKLIDTECDEDTDDRVNDELLVLLPNKGELIFEIGSTCSCGSN